MPKENDLKEKESKKAWWRSTIAICLIYPIVVGIAICTWQFILPIIWPTKPRPPEKEVIPIQYKSQGLPLSEIIKHIEGETDYNVITTKAVEEIKIYGSFQGDNWLHILKKVVNAYDKQLKLDLDEENKRITITLRKNRG